MNRVAAVGLAAVLTLGGLTACGSNQNCGQSLGALNVSTVSLPTKGGGGGGHSSGGHSSSGHESSTSGGRSSGSRGGFGGYRPSWYPGWMPWMGASNNSGGCK